MEDIGLAGEDRIKVERPSGKPSLESSLARLECESLRVSCEGGKYRIRNYLRVLYGNLYRVTWPQVR